MTVKTKPVTPETRKKKFIHALAVFLTADLGRRSIGLEMISKGQASSPFACEIVNWQKLWDASRLFGYPSVEEAERHLTEILSDSSKTP